MSTPKTKRYPEFNTAWFRHQMEKHDLTYEDLAKAMGIEFATARATAFKVIQGEQRLRGEWAAALAEAFRVPLEDVLKEAGLLGADMVLTRAKKKNTVRIEGELNAGAVMRIKGKEARRTAPLPPGMPDHSHALIIGAEGPFRGWTAYYLPAESVVDRNVGRVCLVDIDQHLTLGKLERGTKPGYFTVQPLSGRRIEDVRVLSAAPVLWMSAE